MNQLQYDRNEVWDDSKWAWFNKMQDQLDIQVQTCSIMEDWVRAHAYVRFMLKEIGVDKHRTNGLPMELIQNEVNRYGTGLYIHGRKKRINCLVRNMKMGTGWNFNLQRTPRLMKEELDLLDDTMESMVLVMAMPRCAYNPALLSTRSRERVERAWNPC